MKNLAPITLLMSILLFTTSCRNDLMNLQHGSGDLTVSVSIEKSLYLGEYIQDSAGRFVGPGSSSLKLTYITGSKEYSTDVDITLSGSGTSFTGTATLKDLPAGVEGTVQVATFDASGSILCDGS